MSRMTIGRYDHLNDTDPIKMTLDMESLANKVVSMNYGTHRFLSALVRARRANDKTNGFVTCDLLTNAIEKALNDGGY